MNNQKPAAQAASSTPQPHPTKKDWIKFIFWTLLYLLFIGWLGSWWALVVVPFIFDAYITRKIPWTWWKESKNKRVKQIMSWVDALVFSFVAVYFVHLYFFQNYVIPSSSLEKSLLTGDYLLVSKMSYGPRVPKTPLHMPMTSHTLPLTGTKSYLEWPQWDYRRVKGFGNVEQNDIVVFNYPSGDSVASRVQAEDYYTECFQRGEQLLPYSHAGLSAQENWDLFALQYELGRNYILANERIYGKILSRPVDMRENFVKRCVGMPGQWLEIKDGVVYTDGKALKQPENVQYNYVVTLKGLLPEDFCKEYGVSVEDREHSISDAGYVTYLMPLTEKVKAALLARPDWVVDLHLAPPTGGTLLYPHNMNTGWTCHNYGPIWIPKRGVTVHFSLATLPLYQRIIEVYEGNKLEVRDGKVFINGEETERYTFKMDYYWMMGDNRDNSSDSRFWGFVPEDHIVGKPLLIWLSLDKDYNLFNGKMRWNRMFRLVDNIK